MKKERLEKLNLIVYRFLVPELGRRLDATEDGLYALDAINLLESGMDQVCDRTIAITSPTELRVRRIMARDADTAEEFRAAANRFFTRLVQSIKEEKEHGV